MTERETKLVAALQARADLYRTRQNGEDFGRDPSYNRYEVFQQKAEAVELAIYEALTEAGLPAERPSWY